jgi:hypothetical protein
MDGRLIQALVGTRCGTGRSAKRSVCVGAAASKVAWRWSDDDLVPIGVEVGGTEVADPGVDGGPRRASGRSCGTTNRRWSSCRLASTTAVATALPEGSPGHLRHRCLDQMAQSSVATADKTYSVLLTWISPPCLVLTGASMIIRSVFVSFVSCDLIVLDYNGR